MFGAMVRLGWRSFSAFSRGFLSYLGIVSISLESSLTTGNHCALKDYSSLWESHSVVIPIHCWFLVASLWILNSIKTFGS